MNAKGLRKKLKNGLIVDKWDLVSIIERQEKEIKELKEKVTGLMAVNEEFRSGISAESLNKKDNDWKLTREYCS